MAKSMRSKWKRKCRAVKRIRYENKELERLKKTLGITETQTLDKLLDATTIVNAAAIKENVTLPEPSENEVEQMEVEGKRRVFNPKTLKDENGSYPIWMHPRKIRKSKNKIKKLKVKRKHQEK